MLILRLTMSLLPSCRIPEPDKRPPTKTRSAIVPQGAAFKDSFIDSSVQRNPGPLIGDETTAALPEIDRYSSVTHDTSHTATSKNVYSSTGAYSSLRLFIGFKIVCIYDSEFNGTDNKTGNIYSALFGFREKARYKVGLTLLE